MGSHSHVCHLRSHICSHFSECVCAGRAGHQLPAHAIPLLNPEKTETWPTLQEPPVQCRSRHMNTSELLTDLLFVVDAQQISCSIVWGRGWCVKKESTEDKKFKLDLGILIINGHMDKIFRRYLRKRKSKKARKNEGAY